MLIDDLLNGIDSVAPFDGAAPWDPVGLQLGGAERPIGSVAVCHEVTEDVVGIAEALGIDTLVAYHPLLFAPTTSLTEGPTAPGRALRLAENRTSLIVVHTALDATIPGTADALVAALGLQLDGTFGGGQEAEPSIGRSCRPGVPLSARALGHLVEQALGCSVRVADAGAEIDSIVVVPGSGGSYIESAVGVADALITGDVSHHIARAATDRGLTVIDAGHAATERPGIEALYSLVCDIVGDATLLEDDPTPWKD